MQLLVVRRFCSLGVCGCLAAWALVALNAGSAVPAVAQEESASAQELASWRQHDWGRFPVGAWRHVRTVTETLGPDGAVVSSSTSDDMTELVRCTRFAVTLRTTSSVEVAGKTFETPPRDIRQGSFGEPISPDVVAKDLGRVRVMLEGREIICRVKQYEIADAETKKLLKVYYSDEVTPFIVKKEEVTTDARGQRMASKTSVDVLALDLPHKVIAQIVPTSLVKEVHDNGKTTVITHAVHAKDVPGGMVAYESKEYDADGALVRRSTMELVDYGAEPHEGTTLSRRRVRLGNRGR